LGNLSEEMVVNLYAGCKALIVCGEEDFGLTPLEAMSLGKPVIGFGVGGVAETVIDGKTGILFDQQSKQSLVEALKKNESVLYNKDQIINQAKSFSQDRFRRDLERIIRQVDKLRLDKEIN
jgi:glycosyltransferase involved in cell wall biosynthesis